MRAPAAARSVGNTRPMSIGAIRRKGYSDTRVRKIAGLNLLRLVRQVTEKR